MTTLNNPIDLDSSLIEKYKEMRKLYTYATEKGALISELSYSIDLYCVDLYDRFQNNIFSDIDYYAVIRKCPIWLRDAGNSAECPISKDRFEYLCQSNNNYITNKFLFFHDCEKLISALQTRLRTIVSTIDKLYSIISFESNTDFTDFVDVKYSSTDESIEATAYINHIFVLLNSCFDLMTKIAIELKDITNIKFDEYPKMKSKNSLFGDKKRVDERLKQNTIFDPSFPYPIRLIQTIRDEFIHNGSWDYNGKIYHGSTSDNQIENWIYMPEFDEKGIWLTYKNRKMFYRKNRLNNILPDIVINAFQLIQSTLIRINEIYEKPCYSNRFDLRNYKDEIALWYKMD